MKQLTAQKSINYHGVNLIVPDEKGWLAGDADGYLWAFTEDYEKQCNKVEPINMDIIYKDLKD
jgi:hypothetical protein